MKNSTPLAGWSFWAWGTGDGAWGRSYQCPMPQATGRLSRYTHKGMEFLVAFNELPLERSLLLVLNLALT
ncbi:MAG: hypothetical protein V7K98_02495 [Nostoc sp.]|uniref:hypothetical protein n=1 Tax=Nostoc sp. TaxID=1180 RepID=UPI002FF5D238